MFNYLHLVNCFYFSFIGLNDHSYDVEKRPRRTAKPRRPAQDPPKERMSTYSVGVVLRDWSVQFLECCYNILMKVVRVTIMHHSDIYIYCVSLSLFSLFSLSLSLPLSLSLSLSLHSHMYTITCQENILHQRAMDNDETYYLWAMRFFMEFSRHHHFRVDIVG